VCLELSSNGTHQPRYGYPVIIMIVAGVREIKSGYPRGTGTKKKRLTTTALVSLFFPLDTSPVTILEGKTYYYQDFHFNSVPILKDEIFILIRVTKDSFCLVYSVFP
jgi:hypothetical protein